jgi:hypothetical protein
MVVEVPHTIRIEDPKLFFMHSTMIAAVLSYFFYLWVTDPHLIQLSETPVSFASFEFTRGTFNDDRNKSWASFPYCSNESYK